MEMTLQKKLTELHKKKAYSEAQRDTLTERITKNETIFTAATKELGTLTECSEFLGSLSLSLQETTTKKVAEIVTAIYQVAFDNDDEFIIETDTKRKVPVARFLIKTKKKGVTVLLDPVKNEGGGKRDVIGIGLRVAGLVLLCPAQDRVLILDEPFRQLSSSSTSKSLNKQRAVQLLKSIATKYNIQVIVISHDEEFVVIADKVYEVTADGDKYAIVRERK